MKPPAGEHLVTPSSRKPELEDHFVRGTLCRFLMRRHPYDFIESYVLLREVFGYKAHYVNLGYWSSGPFTDEPGRRLTMALADTVGLARGQSVIEVGSGLGQAAVDLCRAYDLDSYIGLNKNARQVVFANALANAEGLDGRILHVLGDACHDLERLESPTCNAILAMECVGHFRDPDRFLSSAHRLLRESGRLAVCFNVAKGRLSPLQRWLYYSSLGHLPASLDTWINRLRKAGFRSIAATDWTDMVLIPSMRFALDRLHEGRSTLNPIIDQYLSLQFATALRSASRGDLGYYAVTAAR